MVHDEDEKEGDEDAGGDKLDEADETLVKLGLLDEDAADDGDALDDGKADALGDIELLLVAPVDKLGGPVLDAIPDAEVVPQADDVREPLTVADGKPDVVRLTENELVALSLEHRLALVSPLADAGIEPVMVPDTVPDPIAVGELEADDDTLPVREAHAVVVDIAVIDGHDEVLGSELADGETDSDTHADFDPVVECDTESDRCALGDRVGDVVAVVELENETVAVSEVVTVDETTALKDAPAERVSPSELVGQAVAETEPDVCGLTLGEPDTERLTSPLGDMLDDAENERSDEIELEADSLSDARSETDGDAVTQPLVDAVTHAVAPPLADTAAERVTEPQSVADSVTVNDGEPLTETVAQFEAEIDTDVILERVSGADCDADGQDEGERLVVPLRDRDALLVAEVVADSDGLTDDELDETSEPVVLGVPLYVTLDEPEASREPDAVVDGVWLTVVEADSDGHPDAVPLIEVTGVNDAPDELEALRDSNVDTETDGDAQFDTLGERVGKIVADGDPLEDGHPDDESNALALATDAEGVSVTVTVVDGDLEVTTVADEHPVLESDADVERLTLGDDVDERDDVLQRVGKSCVGDAELESVGLDDTSAVGVKLAVTLGEPDPDGDDELALELDALFDTAGLADDEAETSAGVEDARALSDANDAVAQAVALPLVDTLFDKVDVPHDDGDGDVEAEIDAEREDVPDAQADGEVLSERQLVRVIDGEPLAERVTLGERDELGETDGEADDDGLRKGENVGVGLPERERVPEPVRELHGDADGELVWDAHDDDDREPDNVGDVDGEPVVLPEPEGDLDAVAEPHELRLAELLRDPLIDDVPVALTDGVAVTQAECEPVDEGENVLVTDAERDTRADVDDDSELDAQLLDDDDLLADDEPVIKDDGDGETEDEPLLRIAGVVVNDAE